jgi:hypothetical protein
MLAWSIDGGQCRMLRQSRAEFVSVVLRDFLSATSIGRCFGKIGRLGNLSQPEAHTRLGEREVGTARSWLCSPMSR